MHYEPSWLIPLFSCPAFRSSRPSRPPCGGGSLPRTGTRELGTKCPTTPHHADHSAPGGVLVQWYGPYKFKEEAKLPALFREELSYPEQSLRSFFPIKHT